MLVSIQTRTSGGWSSPKFISVSESERQSAIKGIVMFLDEEIRVAYPSDDFSPMGQDTLVQYIGRLSGHYIHPDSFKVNPFKEISDHDRVSGKYLLDGKYWKDSI